MKEALLPKQFFTFCGSKRENMTDAMAEWIKSHPFAAAAYYLHVRSLYFIKPEGHKDAGRRLNPAELAEIASELAHQLLLRQARHAWRRPDYGGGSYYVTVRQPDDAARGLEWLRQAAAQGDSRPRSAPNRLAPAPASCAALTTVLLRLNVVEEAKRTRAVRAAPRLHPRAMGPAVRHRAGEGRGSVCAGRSRGVSLARLRRARRPARRRRAPRAVIGGGGRPAPVGAGRVHRVDDGRSALRQVRPVSRHRVRLR